MLSESDLARRWAACERLSRVRREAGRVSLKAFAEVYLPEHVTLPSCSMHEEWSALLDRGVQDGGACLAAGMPTGYGKSTWTSLALPLWGICYSHFRFIGIYGSNQADAAERVSNIAREIRTNRRLIADFPHLRQAGRGWAGSGQRHDLQIGPSIRIVALAPAKDAQTLRCGPHKVDLLIYDDVERGVSSLTDQRRARVERWLRDSTDRPPPGSCVGEGACLRVVVGSLRERDSVLEGLLDRPPAGWTVRRYGAVERYASRPLYWALWERVHGGRSTYLGQTGPAAAERMLQDHRPAMLRGAQPLWPQRESYEDLMRRKLAMGCAAFELRLQTRLPKPGGGTVVMSFGRRVRVQHHWTDASGIARRGDAPAPLHVRGTMEDDEKSADETESDDGIAES